MGNGEDLTAKGQYRLVKTETQSGIKVKPSYGPDDIEGLDYEKDLGDPGQWPFTRATHDGLYRNMLWLHENLYMTGSERFKETWIHRVGLSMPNPPGYDGNFFYNPCDAAREAGVDPDHPMARLEIGCAGNVHYCLRNLEDDLETVPNEKLKTLYLCSLDAPSHGDTPRYAQHIALFEKRGIPLEEMRGFQVNDGIHIHIIRWCDSNPLDLSFRLSVDSMEFSAKNTPQYYPICPNMYDMRETGIDVIQEVAFNLSERIAFIDEAMKRGVKFEQLTHRIDISFTGEIDFFETICKIRAARRMWARIAKERYGCTDPKYMRPPTGINMAGSAMTAQQPVNNISRIAIISLACALAGVRSIQPKNFLEPLPVPWLPGTMYPSIATQYIIAHETGVPLVADPLGGSYYVEWLTNKIEEESGKLMKEIEDRGGILECIRSGWIQGEAEKKALNLQRELEEGRRIQVGVNAFQIPKDIEVPIPEIELEDLEKWPGGEKFEGLEEYQLKILKEIKEFKEGRDSARTREGLLRLREASENGENLIRPMIEAYKADATTGEVMGMVREGMGYSYDPFNVIERPEFLNQ